MQKQVFVARDRELGELNEALDKALSGQGQVCFISGQAGSGKTALVQRFAEQAQGSQYKSEQGSAGSRQDDQDRSGRADLVVAMGTCNAQTGIGDPYLPFREVLSMLTNEVTAQHAAGRISPENTNRLRTVLVRSVQVLVEVAPELVGVFVPGASLVGAVGKAVAKKVGWMDRLDELAEQSATATADVVAEQSRIFEQYTAFLRTLSEKVPLILFLDDLQWADGASLNLLFHLGRRLEDSRILVLGAYRPDDVALGRGGERHPLEPVINELTRYYGDVTVDLDAIAEQTRRAFVEAILDAQPNNLGDPFREALYHQTGGHALFTVEILQHLKDQGDLVRNADGSWIESRSIDWNSLPSRVEGVIEERLARLPQGLRELLQVASVQGEEFSAEIVARVQKMADREAIWQFSRELQRRHRLVNASGLVHLARIRLSRYHFVHNLFQHHVYCGLTEAEQVYLHRDIGQALEEMLAGETEEVAAQLARHFEQAKIPAKAATYLLQAGNRARRLSAHQEATEFLSRGLAATSNMATGLERTQVELELQVSLGKALLALYGYASPRVDRVFARALELCHTLADQGHCEPSQMVQILLAQAAFRLMRGNLESAHDAARQVLGLAEQAGAERIVLTSHLLLGATALYRGKYEDARVHLEQVLALHDPTQYGDLVYQQGQDPGVQALAFLSRVRWLQGYPEQALGLCREALELAEGLDHPYSCTIAALHAATLRAWLQWWPECQEHAENALSIARQGGFKMREANALVLLSIAGAHQGRIREGIDGLVKGLYMWEASGAGLVAYGLACLAEAYLLAGQQDEGLRAADESIHDNEETWWLPEQYRLRAELLLLSPGTEPEAEALLRRAADLARNQKARALELRVLTSLVRLQQQRGHKPDALHQLAQCHGSFTEGSGLPDLQAAEALLSALEVQMDQGDPVASTTTA